MARLRSVHWVSEVSVRGMASSLSGRGVVEPEMEIVEMTLEPLAPLPNPTL